MRDCLTGACISGFSRFSPAIAGNAPTLRRGVERRFSPTSSRANDLTVTVQKIADMRPMRVGIAKALKQQQITYPTALHCRLSFFRFRQPVFGFLQREGKLGSCNS